MSGSPAVVVNKGGFLSAIVKGLFGTLMVLLICGTMLGLSGLWFADKQITRVTHMGAAVSEKVLEVLPEWQKVLPPAIADALNDRRAPEYRDKLQINARLASARQRKIVVLEVANNGDEIVSLLPIRIAVEDSGGVPIRDFALYAATPFQACDDWPGPMLPQGGTRKMSLCAGDVPEDAKVTIEITDVRVSQPPQPRAIEAPVASSDV